MTKSQLAMLLGGFVLIAGCSEEPRYRSVTEFLEDPIVLEATVVRCAQHRDKTRYDSECVNARQAISILEAREDRDRAKAFEAQSELKRKALRRTQEAAAEARRRATVAERMRREAAYLAQFGELPPPEDAESTVDDSAGNAPGMVLPERKEDPATGSGSVNTLPASDGGNAPVVETEAPADLNAIREELQRRNGDSGN